MNRPICLMTCLCLTIAKPLLASEELTTQPPGMTQRTTTLLALGAAAAFASGSGAASGVAGDHQNTALGPAGNINIARGDTDIGTNLGSTTATVTAGTWDWFWDLHWGVTTTSGTH